MVQQRSGGWVSEMWVEWTLRNLSVEVVFLGCIESHWTPDASLNLVSGGPTNWGDVDAHTAAGVGWWQGGHVWRTLVPGLEHVSHWCQCVCQGLSYLVAAKCVAESVCGT